MVLTFAMRSVTPSLSYIPSVHRPIIMLWGSVTVGMPALKPSKVVV